MQAPGKEREWIAALLHIPLSIHFLQLKLSFHLCVCVCVCVSLYLVPPPLHPFYLYPQTKHGYLQSNEEEEFLQQVADVLQKTKLEKKKPSPKLQAQDTKPAPPSESDPPKTKVVGSSKPSDISGHQEVKPKAAETKGGDAAWTYFVSALCYLHGLEEPIIHRDVNSANVLLKAMARSEWSHITCSKGKVHLADLHRFSESCVKLVNDLNQISFSSSLFPISPLHHLHAFIILDHLCGPIPSLFLCHS